MPFGLVHEDPETSPDSSGGPIRRSPLLVMRSGDGMPPNGYPQMVLRTPHQVVPDAEPGGAAFRRLRYMKFLPDGRLVRAGALGGSFGADASDVVPPSAQAAIDEAKRRLDAALELALTWGLVSVGGLAVLTGALLLGPSGHRLRTGVLATAAYGGGVAITRYIKKRTGS